MLFEQRQQKVFHSRDNLTPSTSVKKVISELEATFGLHNNRLERKTALPRPEVISSIRTQTDCEVPEAVSPRLVKCHQHVSMESDSSFHDSKLAPPPLTTVSVSTCPSCGSENVSSECHPTKRSASFQHLLHSSRSRPFAASSSKLSPNIDTNHLLRSQSFTFNVPETESCDCHCRCGRSARPSARVDAARAKKLRKKKSPREPRPRRVADDRCLNVYPEHYWSPPRPAVKLQREVSACHRHGTGCSREALFDPSRGLAYRPTVRIDRQPSYVDMAPGLRSNYRYWDIEEWREQMKRDRAKKRERRSLITVSAFGIIVFICVSYFGTLLFLRITRLP